MTFFNYWQLSPALDLQAIKSQSSKLCNDVSNEPFQSFKDKIAIQTPSEERKDKSFNCLIIGSGHACLAKTISRAVRHKAMDVNIYISEQRPEFMARHLILLSLFARENSDLGIEDTADMYLEIFGNSFVRASTYDRMARVSSDINEAITKSQESLEVDSIISYKHFKHSELDAIMSTMLILKNTSQTFDIKQAWDSRLRSFLGSRYDSRRNIFDYDFNMRLSNLPILNLRKYIHWRETGVAFKFREARLAYPNKSLLSLKNSDKSSGGKEMNDAFTGDITTSPYLAFGVECGDESFFKKTNNEYEKTSEDISKFNIVDLMEEFSFASQFAPELKRKVCPIFVETLCRRHQKFKHFFDAVYLSLDMVPCAELIPLVLKENGIVVVERVENLVNLSKEAKKKHYELTMKVMDGKGVTVVKELSNDFHSVFVKVSG